MGYTEFDKLWGIENHDFANNRLQALEHVAVANTESWFLGTKLMLSTENGVETTRLVTSFKGRLKPAELKSIKRRAMFSIHQDLVALGEKDAANAVIESSANQ